MMKLANAKIVSGLENPSQVMSLLETIGRISHASGPSKSLETADKFVSMLIRLGHESVLEHVSVTVLVECDRAMAQQWTRHRLAAYTMESQRYVSYKDDLSFIDPEFRVGTTYYTESEPGEAAELYSNLNSACILAKEEYQLLRDGGAPPEDARAVLPNCARTLFYTTANLRSWRHIFNERCAPGAQHNIRRVMKDLLKQFHTLLPVVFQDLVDKYK
jgi:thymidylate synthase (FAD)